MRKRLVFINDGSFKKVMVLQDTAFCFDLWRYLNHWSSVFMSSR